MLKINNNLQIKENKAIIINSHPQQGGFVEKMKIAKRKKKKIDNFTWTEMISP